MEDNMFLTYVVTLIIQLQKKSDSTHRWTFSSFGTLRTLHERGHKHSNLTKSFRRPCRILMNDWISKRLTGRPGGPGGPRGPADPPIPCDIERDESKSHIYIKETSESGSILWGWNDKWSRKDKHGLNIDALSCFALRVTEFFINLDRKKDFCFIHKQKTAVSLHPEVQFSSFSTIWSGNQAKRHEAYFQALK